MAHSIITVATMKGGSGKSTLASCLAVHWQLNGRRSAIIDADPQSTIARLAAREKALGGVPVIEDSSEEAFKTAQRLVGEYVIIDTPGFRSQATLACLGVTDFVLVPVKPSPFDVDRMLDTLNVLINGVSGRRPTFRCVLTQTTRDSVIAKHIRSELAAGRLPGARQRDDQPRRLCRGGAVGRDAELLDKKGAGGARDRGDRRRGASDLRQHGSRQTGGKRMNKKKLPKAVLRTAEQMRESRRRAPRTEAARPDNVIEMMPKAEPRRGPDHRRGRGRHRAAAQGRRHRRALCQLSAVGGAIPVPLVNAAAITALLVRMVKSLSELYDVPFERNRTRSIVIGLMGGALPTGFSTIATSTLTCFVPGLNLMGLAVCFGDVGRLRPQHRPAFHRALRERRGDRSSLDHQALMRRRRCVNSAFCSSACLAIRSIRLFGRMSVQF